MATQSQKIEAAHKLMLDPNTKLTDEYLNSIKLSMLSGYSDLKNLNLVYTCYMSKSFVMYLKWKVDVSNCDRKQINKLKKLGFKQSGLQMINSGFTTGFSDDAPFWVFIQNIKTPIDVTVVSYDDVIFSFLEKIELNLFTIDETTGTRQLTDYFNFDHLQMIERSLGLRTFLTDWCDWEDYAHNVTTNIACEKKGKEYILNITGDVHLTVISDRPLTVSNILRLREYQDIRVLVLNHYLNNNISNVLKYDDKTTPTDPLILFNMAIDGLQEKGLPLNELAKELILLSAKHLE